MSYADYTFYGGLFSDGLTEQDFARLSWEAARELDRHTTGIDGVRKLKNAFPQDEDFAEAVKHCECSLVHLMHQIEEAEKVQQEGRGYVPREDGTIMGKVVSSVSSGSESISYSAGEKSRETAIDAAVKDTAARKALFADTVRKYLSGVTDANGINLLYMGTYPCVIGDDGNV